MQHEIGTKVKVVTLTDETVDISFMGKEGEVKFHNTNELTGNKVGDPLHLVSFPDNSEEYFWHEELEPIK